MIEELAHLPDEQRILIAVTLGDNIERALADKTSPFARMMANARDSYVNALEALISSDLRSEVGLKDAISVQAEARRYQDLCFWINDAMEAAGQAEDEAESELEEPAVEELKEQMHGIRDKPAPDA